MRFEYPIAIFFGFWACLFLVLFYFWAYSRRRAQAERFAERDLVPKITQPMSGREKFLLPVLFILAIAMFFVALAHPQWGVEFKEPPKAGLDIIVAIDTSRSMFAEDVSPNRLERAKLAVGDFLNQLQGDRIGLIAFSYSAFLQSPLSVDYDGFLLSLDDLDVDTIPRQGTSIAAAIDKAIESYKSVQNKSKVLIIITDGEDHEGKIANSAKEAQKENIKIFCIGIGSKNGEFLYSINRMGKKVYFKDKKGARVKSKLNEALLKKIASVTNGAYIHATNTDFGLKLIYEKKLSRMVRTKGKVKLEKEHTDRFWIFLFTGCLILLLYEVIMRQVRQKI